MASYVTPTSHTVAIVNIYGYLGKHCPLRIRITVTTSTRARVDNVTSDH